MVVMRPSWRTVLMSTPLLALAVTACSSSSNAGPACVDAPLTGQTVPRAVTNPACGVETVNCGGVECRCMEQPLRVLFDPLRERCLQGLGDHVRAHLRLARWSEIADAQSRRCRLLFGSAATDDGGASSSSSSSSLVVSSSSSSGGSTPGANEQGAPPCPPAGANASSTSSSSGGSGSGGTGSSSGTSSGSTPKDDAPNRSAPRKPRPASAVTPPTSTRTAPRRRHARRRASARVSAALRASGPAQGPASAAAVRRAAARARIARPASAASQRPNQANERPILHRQDLLPAAGQHRADVLCHTGLDSCDLVGGKPVPSCGVTDLQCEGKEVSDCRGG